jgi:hypothetical protein
VGAFDEFTSSDHRPVMVEMASPRDSRSTG